MLHWCLQSWYNLRSLQIGFQSFTVCLSQLSRSWPCDVQIWKATTDHLPFGWNSMKNCQCIMFPFNCQGIARTQSPTTKNCTPEFPTFGGIADFSQARCNALASTWAACLRDHKQPAPGKLIRASQLGSYEETVLWKLMVNWQHYKHLWCADVTCLHYSTCMPDSLHIVHV